LLDAGAEVDVFGQGKVTALMFSPSRELTKLLLRHGANVEAVGDKGFAPTRFSGAFGTCASLEVLFQAGGDPGAAVHGVIAGLLYRIQFGTDEQRVVALNLALWAGASPTNFLFRVSKSLPLVVVQKLLCYGGSPTEVDENGLIPIQLAFKNGASPAVLSLLAPHDGYELTDPKTNKIVVVTKTDPGPPQFTSYELDFDFCSHCRKGWGPADMLTCAACMLVAYCGQECQQAHRVKHKPICKAKRRADKWRAKFEK
jgi:ankyrin repeat protein